MHSTSGRYSLCCIAGTTCTLQSSSGYYCQSPIPFFPGTNYNTVYFWSISCKACILPRHYHYPGICFQCLFLNPYARHPRRNHKSMACFWPIFSSPSFQAIYLYYHPLLVSIPQALYPSSKARPLCYILYLVGILEALYLLHRHYQYTTVDSQLVYSQPYTLPPRHYHYIKVYIWQYS